MAEPSDPGRKPFQQYACPDWSSL